MKLLHFAPLFLACMISSGCDRSNMVVGRVADKNGSPIAEAVVEAQVPNN